MEYKYFNSRRVTGRRIYILINDDSDSHFICSLASSIRNGCFCTIFIYHHCHYIEKYFFRCLGISSPKISWCFDFFLQIFERLFTTLIDRMIATTFTKVITNRGHREAIHYMYMRTLLDKIYLLLKSILYGQHATYRSFKKPFAICRPWV